MKKIWKVKIAGPLKHLINFWRTLDILLINCEINLILTWPERCILTDKATQAAIPAKGDKKCFTRPAINSPTQATLYVHKIACTSSNFINSRWN